MNISRGPGDYLDPASNKILRRSKTDERNARLMDSKSILFKKFLYKSQEPAHTDNFPSPTATQPQLQVPPLNLSSLSSTNSSRDFPLPPDTPSRLSRADPTIYCLLDTSSKSDNTKTDKGKSNTNTSSPSHKKRRKSVRTPRSDSLTISKSSMEIVFQNLLEFLVVPEDSQVKACFQQFSALLDFEFLKVPTNKIETLFESVTRLCTPDNQKVAELKEVLHTTPTTSHRVVRKSLRSRTPESPKYRIHDSPNDKKKKEFVTSRTSQDLKESKDSNKDSKSKDGEERINKFKEDKEDEKPYFDRKLLSPRTRKMAKMFNDTFEGFAKPPEIEIEEINRFPFFVHIKADVKMAKDLQTIHSIVHHYITFHYLPKYHHKKFSETSLLYVVPYLDLDKTKRDTYLRYWTILKRLEDGEVPKLIKEQELGNLKVKRNLSNSLHSLPVTPRTPPPGILQSLKNI